MTNAGFDLAVAFDDDAAKRALAAGRGVIVANGLDELLATTLDLVVVTGPMQTRAEIGLRVLEAGHDLVLPTPIACNLDDAKRLYAAAEHQGRQITVWSEGREESDFRSASATVRSGLIGTVRLLRFERWERMVRESDDTVHFPLAPFASQFDQLTALVDAPGETVFVRPIDSAGFTAIVSFHGGAVASLLLNSAAATRLDHGWAIDGMAGGYQQGRRSVLTREEEIYDVPADVLPSPYFEEVLCGDSGGMTLVVSRREALRLVALLAAAERSLQSGRLEQVEPVE